MKKYFNKKLLKKVIIFIVLVGIIAFGYNYSFNSPTIVNSFIASNLYGAPANASFEDDNFYKCVVDAYNAEKGASISYTESLSDDQLKEITILSCNGIEKEENELIKKTTGINKLTGLKSLYLGDNLIENLDVSSNTMLEQLYVSGNKLGELDVSHNKNLSELAAAANELTELDISENINLEYIYVSGNELSVLDVSLNTQLERLEANINNLESLNVSNNTKLNYLNVSNNQLSSLYLGEIETLISLVVNNNKLTYIDLSKQKDLTALGVKNNELTDLDLTNNNKLEYFEISGNPYFETVYVYKGDSVTIGNNVKLPSNLNSYETSWDYDGNKITINGNTVSTLDVGNVEVNGVVNFNTFDGSFNTTSMIHIYNITSDKYTINNDKEYVYIGTDTNNTVLNNIRLVNGHESMNIDINNTKLQITTAPSNEVIKEYDLLKVNFGDLSVSEKNITLSNPLSYNSFISNIERSAGITYKIVKNTAQVTSGNIENGMLLKFYYGSEELDTYNITVTEQEKSSNNYLSALVLNKGTIDFNKNTTIYNLTVENDVSVIAVNASLEDSKASFVTNYGPRAMDLKVGSNVIEIKVKAENGNVKTYTINVIRKDASAEQEKSSNNYLSKIELSEGTIVFDKNTTTYNVTVLYDVEEIDVIAVTEDSKAIVEVTGNKELNVGENLITVKVTAEDGTIKEYKITVIRSEENVILSSDSKLNNISIDGYNINFEPSKYEYTVKIVKEEKLNITYELSDSKSTVTIIGNEDLKDGSIVKVVVTAENGTTTTYEINIEEADGPQTGYAAVIIQIVCVLGLGALVLGITYFKKGKNRIYNKI